ncbi:MAG: hypothetical protein LAN37_05235 [Acidobacteriia bacterium]|nr:hypothetical protein [Terriglobia bacterium]
MSTAVIIPFAPQTTETTAAMERYEHGYSVSRMTSGFGETIRLVGISLAGALWLCALVAYQAIPAERSGFPVVSVSLIAAALWIVLVSRVVGAGFRVQAQLLEAAVDSAVTASPFLSNPQRLEVMSLRKPPEAVGWQCSRVRDLAVLGQHGPGASPSIPLAVVRPRAKVEQRVA